MGSNVDISGLNFGRLTAVRQSETKHGPERWVFRCVCGSIIIAFKGNVTSGKTKSCGCFKKDQTRKSNSTHGLSGTRLYKIWGNMIHRCHNKTDSRYKDYGGRGVQVCMEWRNGPEMFVSWALANGYSDELTLDRANNNEGYSPQNCKWATRDEQARNKRTNHFIDTPKGKMTIKDAAKDAGVKTTTLRNRIWNNRPYDDLLAGMVVAPCN